MRLKRRDLLALLEGITKLNATATGKFGYILAKNRTIIMPEVEAMKAADKPTPEYTKYIRAVEAWRTLPDKTMEGHKRIEDEYAATIEARIKQVRDIETILDEEIELPLDKISMKQIPADTAYLQNIFLIIEE